MNIYYMVKTFFIIFLKINRKLTINKHKNLYARKLKTYIINFLFYKASLLHWLIQ